MASREFSKYSRGTKSKVSRMVDKDDIREVKPFYENLNTANLPVKYIPNFWDALIQAQTHNIIIISTKIDIVNQETCGCIDANKNIIAKIPKTSLSSHAVSVIKDRNHLYLFDPNGVTLHDDTWLYLNKDKNKAHYSENFKLYIQNYFNINITLPKERGVQFYCEAPDTGFIHKQGYCMFYNYIGIAKAIQFKKKNKQKYITTFLKKINNKKNKARYFPSDKDVGNTTKTIIDEIFIKP